MRTALVLASLVLLAGCGTAWTWSRPGTTQEQFQSDSAACFRASPNRPGCADATTFVSCMAARGYVGPNTAGSKGEFVMSKDDGSRLCE